MLQFESLPEAAAEKPAEAPADALPPLAGGALKVPSCRDFEIYQQVAFEGMSQRKAAALHKIRSRGSTRF